MDTKKKKGSVSSRRFAKEKEKDFILLSASDASRSRKSNYKDIHNSLLEVVIFLIRIYKFGDKIDFNGWERMLTGRELGGSRDSDHRDYNHRA